MAVPADLAYLESVLPSVGRTVLEIGARDWQGGGVGNMQAVVTASGRQWEGCDLEAGPGVAFTLDVLDDGQVAAVGRTWDTVLLFNLLEHVYDPPTALANTLRLVANGGTCVICGPAIWELHDFPGDFWRPMPDFFLEFARRQGDQVRSMHWVLNEHPYIPRRPPTIRILEVGELTTTDGQKQVPSRLTSNAIYGRPRTAISVAVQRALNLTGRVNRFPNVGLGVVVTKGPRP